MILKPWDERTRSAQQIEAAVAGKAQRGRGDERLRLLAAAAAGLDRRAAGADGDLFDRRFRLDLRGDGADQGRGAQERPVHRRRQRSRLQPADDPRRCRPLARPTSSASRCSRSATRWRCWSARTTSTASTSSGRSYEVIPQVPRVDRLNAGHADPAITSTRRRASRCRCRTSSRSRRRTAPNALTHYNQLNSATFQAVPMPGVTMGQAVDFLEQQAKTAAARVQPRLPVGFAAIRAGRQRSSSSPSSSR